MSLIPLSWILNSQKNGYKIDKHNINHLIYMDDLKIYSSSNKQTTSLVNISSVFLQNIELELGPAKCASATLIKGKKMPSSWTTQLSEISNQTRHTNILELHNQHTFTKKK